MSIGTKGRIPLEILLEPKLLDIIFSIKFKFHKTGFKAILRINPLVGKKTRNKK